MKQYTEEQRQREIGKQLRRARKPRLDRSIYRDALRRQNGHKLPRRAQ
jgi:hypothetical protein